MKRVLGKPGTRMGMINTVVCARESIPAPLHATYSDPIRLERLNINRLHDVTIELAGCRGEHLLILGHIPERL
jgi:hypothetical protein